MKNNFFKNILKIFGLILIILGVAAWFLPFISGWLLIVLGAIILGKDSKISKWISKLLPEKFKDKIK